MKTPISFFKKFVFTFSMVLFLFVNSGCSKDIEPENQALQDPLIEAKTNFSNALSLWNHPGNFDRSDGKTEPELLQNRLELVYEEAKNLLLLSGMSEETLQTKSKGDVFILAIKTYGSNYDN